MNAKVNIPHPKVILVLGAIYAAAKVYVNLYETVFEGPFRHQAKARPKKRKTTS